MALYTETGFIPPTDEIVHYFGEAFSLLSGRAPKIYGHLADGSLLNDLKGLPKLQSALVPRTLVVSTDDSRASALQGRSEVIYVVRSSIDGIELHTDIAGNGGRGSYTGTLLDSESRGKYADVWGSASDELTKFPFAYIPHAKAFHAASKTPWGERDDYLIFTDDLNEVLLLRHYPIFYSRGWQHDGVETIHFKREGGGNRPALVPVPALEAG